MSLAEAIQRQRRFVEITALSLTPRGVRDHDDLAAAGWTGLIEAFRRWDPAKASLNTYVRPRIRGAMLDELREIDPISRTYRDRLRRVREVRARGHGSDLVVAHLVGLTEEQLARCDAAEAIDAAMHEDEDELTGDPRGPDPVGEAERRELALLVREAVDELPPREAALMRARLAGLTLKRIGELFGFSESRASQLQKRAQARLGQSARLRRLAGEVE